MKTISGIHRFGRLFMCSCFCLSLCCVHFCFLFFVSGKVMLLSASILMYLFQSVNLCAQLGNPTVEPDSHNKLKCLSSSDSLVQGPHSLARSDRYTRTLVTSLGKLTWKGWQSSFRMRRGELVEVMVVVVDRLVNAWESLSGLDKTIKTIVGTTGPFKAEMLMQDILEDMWLSGFPRVVTPSIHDEVLEILSEPRIKDRVMEEGYKGTWEERNEMLREEWVY